MTRGSTVGTWGGSASSSLLIQEDGFLSLFGGGHAVGLSIGSSSVKLVELALFKKTWKLVKAAVLPLSDESISNREVVNPLSVSEVIRQLARTTRLKSKNVCLGIGGPSFILKRMQLDVPNKKELQDIVFWEAEQYLPFDPSEVSMDYHVVSMGKDGKTDVIFVAVKTSVAQGYIGAVEGAQLKAKTIDSEFFALQNIFEANFSKVPGQAVALVDLGAASTKVVIVQDGAPLYTKDTALGGNQLTQDLQKNLNLSFQDAEALKISASSGQAPQEVMELIGLASENFALEIKRAIDFYSASSSGASVAFVLLTGGSSKLPGLSQMVEEKVELPTQLLNPFTQVLFDEKVFTPEMIQTLSPLIAVPMGLAIRGGAS